MTYPLLLPAPLRSRVRRAIRGLRHGISALDQLALGVFGFGLNLCLVRALSASDYGTVALWMSMSFIAIAVQNALVNAPLSVHVPAAGDRASAQRLETALGSVNLLTIGATAGVVVIVDLSVSAAWAPHDVLAAIAIPAFMAAGMYREFYRSLAFSRNDMTMLLWTDGPYLAVTVLCLAAMLAWPQRLASLAVAFLAMSLGCLASRACLSGRFRLPTAQPFRGGWVSAYRPIMRDAGWALVGGLSNHLHQRSYVYVTVNLVSLAGLAAINAVGVLFRPVGMLVTAWGRTAVPRMSALFASGQAKAFDRALAQGFFMVTIWNALWFVVLWLGWGAIERHFLAGNYPDAWSLMWPWSIASGINAMAYTFSVALQAAREFKFLAYATLLGVPVTIAVTAGAILWQGYTMTMYGVAVGNLLSLIVSGVRLFAARRRLAAAPAAHQAGEPTAPEPGLGTA